jgi:hypothetical protein
MLGKGRTKLSRSVLSKSKGNVVNAVLEPFIIS